MLKLHAKTLQCIFIGLISYGGSNCLLLLADLKSKEDFDSIAPTFNVAFSESKHAVFIADSRDFVDTLDVCRFQKFEGTYLTRRSLVVLGETITPLISQDAIFLL